MNYFLMKCEILVEIWLKLADGDHNEAKIQKQVFEWYPTGSNMHESQENLSMSGRLSPGGQG